MPSRKYHSLTIRIIGESLPGIRFVDCYYDPAGMREPVYIGIQKKQETIDLQRGDSKRVVFEAEFRIGERKDGGPNFLGPYAHGTPKQRFIYLGWGVLEAEGSFEMFRRAKIHLSHINWKQVEKAIENDGVIMARIPFLTDAKGGPLCASLKDDQIEWDI